MKVNRYLKDKAMDRIDHALGRPLNPLAETFRNHFAVEAEDTFAAEMRTSPHWDGGDATGRMAFSTSQMQAARLWLRT